MRPPLVIIYLAAYLEATLKGASGDEAALIAQVIEARPWPSYEERFAHFSTTWPWKPALDAFKR